MRAIRVGLFSAFLLTTLGAPAGADILDIDTLFDAGSGGGQTLTNPCLAILCSSDSSVSNVEIDAVTGSSAGIEEAALLSLEIDEPSPVQGLALIGTSGILEFDLKPGRSHSVPEPGTLLLMGLGLAAAGLLQRLRIQPVR